MEKTAMQALIDEIEKLISIKSFQKWEGLKTEYLAKERQQIIDTYNEGYREGEFDAIDNGRGLPLDISEYDIANNYYTKTYTPC